MSILACTYKQAVTVTHTPLFRKDKKVYFPGGGTKCWRVCQYRFNSALVKMQFLLWNSISAWTKIIEKFGWHYISVLNTSCSSNYCGDSAPSSHETLHKHKIVDFPRGKYCSADTNNCLLISFVL